MAAASTFQDLKVWGRSHDFVLAVYRVSRSFPREELFGLTSQLRRASVSVPANIAEGFRRRGKADKVRFYNTSQASLEECRYYLIPARDLGYCEVEALLMALDEVARMLDAYMRQISPPRRLFTLLSSALSLFF